MDEATKLLLELDYTIRCTHLDMGGKDTYMLTRESYPVIKKIKKYLSETCPFDHQRYIDMGMTYCPHCLDKFGKEGDL